MGVIIPALSPFCVKEFIDCGFQVSIWNSEFVRGGGSKADLTAESGLSFPLTPILDIEIQTDHLITARQPDLAIVKKQKNKNKKTTTNKQTNKHENLLNSVLCHSGETTE